MSFGVGGSLGLLALALGSLVRFRCFRHYWVCRCVRRCWRSASLGVVCRRWWVRRHSASFGVVFGSLVSAHRWVGLAGLGSQS
jgi:hypothetical protein